MSDHPPLATADAGEPELHIDYWEGVWIRISFAVLAVFVVAVLIAAFAFNIQLPGVSGRVDPNNLDAPGSPFASANLGARELAPGVYEAHIVAQAAPWQFNGAYDYAPITFPAGSDVTFYVTSRDLQHGFKVLGTNINMMVLPGQVSTLRTRFDTPGEYKIVCHEYCGAGHAMMWGKIVIQAPEQDEVTTEDETSPDGGEPEETPAAGVIPPETPVSESAGEGTIVAGTPQGTPVDATTEPGDLPVGTPATEGASAPEGTPEQP